VGKWHLGGEPYYPEKQGFDFSVGGGSAGSVGSHFFPYMKGGKGLLGLEQGQPGEYLADRLTTEAETFLDRNKDKPFFLYFAHYAVHTPIQAKQEKVAKYQAKVRPDDPQKNAKYAAMIESVDESVGRILKKLDDLGLADRTVVFFMSDNGGLAGSTSNAPLRGSKGMLYEGGIREPMIVRWPGVVPAGAASDAIVTSVDFFPTILEMAGVDPPADRPIDGRSFLPALTKPGAFDRGPIFWHYPHYHAGMPGGVVRQGDFKLIEFFEDGNVELYNLKDDLGETKDLAPSMPKKADEMKTLLANWRQSVGAQMMSPNPNYDPAKTKQSGKSAKAPAAKPKKKAA
ncbi:MAG: sulfatase, partial [Candidatus Sumerlaeota bacterium]|nr:sulfatase [Candidatus Sumerlaeota bacterium]